ncbi:MAG: transporter substrate-binding domain-containing protein [Termitinemataceae bacterium]|nr:MAG: transporter substrate-binding domain-containing protein [Termitinemataceae bacterium]
MLKKSKLFFVYALIAVLASLFTLSGCSKIRDLDAIKKSGEIVMYTNAEFPPYEYIGASGKPEGLDVDIAGEIAKDIGCTLRIINASFDGFSLALQNGQADMGVSAISITTDRKETLDFSLPYVVTIQYILVMADNNSVSTIDDLAGKKIAVQLGTTGDFLISEQIDGGVLQDTGAQIVQYKSLQEAVLALKKGDLGAVVSDEGPIKNLAAQNNDTICFKAALASGSIDEEPYGIAVHKGNKELLSAINNTLNKLIASGFVESKRSYHADQSISKD